MNKTSLITSLGTIVLGTSSVLAQGAATSSIPYSRSRPEIMVGTPREETTQQYSWIDINQPKPREIKLHDFITILVDEKAQERFDNQFDRTRNSSLIAVLNEWVRIGKTGNLTNAAENSPTIDANLQGNFGANSGASSREGVQYRITVRVVDIKDNGHLVIEGRKTIRSNTDVFVYTLSGVIDSRSVDNSGNILQANSENIYHPHIAKMLNGRTFDSVKRPWGVRLYDKFSPF